MLQRSAKQMTFRTIFARVVVPTSFAPFLSRPPQEQGVPAAAEGVGAEAAPQEEGPQVSCRSEVRHQGRGGGKALTSSTLLLPQVLGSGGVRGEGGRHLRGQGQVGSGCAREQGHQERPQGEEEWRIRGKAGFVSDSEFRSGLEVARLIEFRE